jgi:hypothetical protein
MQSHPAPGEPLPNSDDMLHPPNEDGHSALEQEGATQDVTTDALQTTPSRRGIWDWARAGTGRLNIIGRIPHPEWRGPVSARNLGSRTNGEVHGETSHEAHDDFSIPSTTATAPENIERQREATAAHLEGFSLASAYTMSPSFAQTKGSSDDLVATASSTGSPYSRANGDEQWTNGETSTPSAAGKDSPPSTPDTPTPQQRRKETFARPAETPTNQESPTPYRVTDQPVKNGDITEEDTSAGSETSSTKRRQAPNDTSESNTPTATKKAPKNINSPYRVPKYKIALAPNLLSPARSRTAST